MSDLEHMDRLYLWQTGKAGRRVHIENPETDRTFCQTENGGRRPLDGRGAEAPAGRRVCENCIDLEGQDKADYREPSLAVLMGERIAETDPELFASAVAPEPERTDKPLPASGKKWTRKKQTRPAHRPRGRKLKRSSAKHPRPFDDPLPW